MIVYEVAVDYAQRLRAKNINSAMNTTEKHEQVKERINELVTQNVKKTNVYKMTTELEEMKNKLEEMTRERDDYKEQTIQQQISLNDLRKKLDTLHQLDSEKTHELEKLNKLYKKKDGISNLEKAIEYINIEIKRKKAEEEYTSDNEDKVESNDVKTVAKVETNVEKPNTVKVVTKVKADSNLQLFLVFYKDYYLNLTFLPKYHFQENFRFLEFYLDVLIYYIIVINQHDLIMVLFCLSS